MKVTKKQYQAALKVIEAYKKQCSVVTKITEDDLDFKLFSVSVPKIKDGIGDEWLTELQNALSEVGFPWFDVGTDDLGYLNISSLEMFLPKYKGILIEAINDCLLG